MSIEGQKDKFLQELALVDREERRAVLRDAVEALRLWYARPYNIDFLAEFKPGEMIFAEIAANKWKPQIAGVVTEVCLDFSYQQASIVNTGFDPRMFEPTIYYQFTPDPSYHYGSDTRDVGGFASFYGKEHYEWKIANQIAALKLKMQYPPPQ